MAPSSGGDSPFARSCIRQSRLMNKQLQEHSCVGPILTQSKRLRFLIAGDQGPLSFPMICCEGASQIQREAVLRTCQAILAASRMRNLHKDRCLKSWFLWACLHGVPVSTCWIAGCVNGIPNVSDKEWCNAVPSCTEQKDTAEGLAVCSEQQNSDPAPGVDSLQVPNFEAERVKEEGDMHLQSMLHEERLGNALQRFGLPRAVCDGKTTIAGSLDHGSLPVGELQADDRKLQAVQSQVRCGDAFAPFVYSAVASLQACFAYLMGKRVGEASNPGPLQTKDTSSRQIRYDPSCGVRIGEAKNPGPSPFGPELESMIKQYVMEAVREAIKEAFKNLGLSAPATATQAPEVIQGGQPAHDAPENKSNKGSPKGKSKNPKLSTNVSDRGKGKAAAAAKPGVSANRDRPEDPPEVPPPTKKGKGQGQAAANEWKLVTRQPKSEEFQLRAQDWNAAVIPFNKLSAAIDATQSDAVLEGVILAEKQEIEHAKLMLQGSKAQYKFLLIYLAKEEKSQKIPGRVQDQLCFRDAIVMQFHSSAVSSSPTPAGLASAPIKVAPLQSVAVYVRVPKQYVNEHHWMSFCKNASKAAATWAADRHVQPLDSFNWAEEKQRTGGQELQVFGIMRVPKKDMSTLLAVSGQQGVFIEPCRSQAPRMKLSWIERIKGETANQYLTRANQHGADFALAVHGGTPMQSFDEYLVASAQDGAYGSPLEVEALARVYDVQIILIPCLADFAVMSFRTSQAKRVLVLWYHDKHIDLLIPKEDVRKYPQAVLSITTGPVHKLRAGGRSTCSRTSKTASEWTIGARSSASLDMPFDRSSVWSRAPSDISLRKKPIGSGGTAVCSISKDSSGVPVLGLSGLRALRGRLCLVVDLIAVGTPCLPPRFPHPVTLRAIRQMLSASLQRRTPGPPASESSPGQQVRRVRIFPDVLQSSRPGAFTGRLNVGGMSLLFL